MPSVARSSPRDISKVCSYVDAPRMIRPPNSSPDPAIRCLVEKGARLWIGGHDLAARRAAERCLVGARRPPSGPLDVAAITPRDADEVAYFAQKLCRRLVAEGTLWIIRPRTTDIQRKPTETAEDEIDAAVKACGFIRTATATVDDEFDAYKYCFSPPGDANDS